MDGLILAIESSGELGGAALLEKGTLVGEELVSGPRKHGAELMPCIDKLFVKNKITREALSVIAVNAGPGSYTGLRIGLMTAAALGFALDKPVIGVGAFDCMALQLVMTRGFDARYKGELWPVLDARRDELMTAKFVFEKGDIKRIGGDVLIPPTEFSKHAAAGSIVFGSGVTPYENTLKPQPLKLAEPKLDISPATVAMQAWRELVNVVDAKAIERKAVAPRYFRHVLAKTTEERANASGVGFVAD